MFALSFELLFKNQPMNTRFVFFVCSGFLLMALASVLHAGGGSYQRTDDGKALVWNNHPLPGDTATWTGDRDLEGYATGYGTLTWSRRELKTRTGSNLPVVKHIELTRYSGMMIRGRLDGPVENVDANGKTFHGTFADGRKTKDWKPGPAPTPSETEVAANETTNESAERASSTEPPPPAAGPTQTLNRGEVFAEQRRNKDVAADAVIETPAAKPSPTAYPRPNVATLADQPAHDISVPALSIAEPKRAEADDSLRSLMSPPALLRKNPGLDSSAEISAPEPTRSTSPAPTSNKPKLVAAEVAQLADAEARSQGYELREYQRSQVRYNPADQTWTVSYDQKSIDSNAMGEMDNNFVVTVEDKTRKVELKK